jgi:hypothetical protein
VHRVAANKVELRRDVWKLFGGWVLVLCGRAIYGLLSMC